MSLSCVEVHMDVPELCGGSHGCVGVHMDVPELCGGSHGCP